MSPVSSLLSSAATRLIAIAAILLPAVLGAATAPAWADSTIRVLVNDDPITSYDVDSRTKMIKLFTQGRQGESAAIDQLITERLMVQEAERQGVSVTDAEIDAEIASRAGAAGMSMAQFKQALQQAGIGRTFREFVRSNLAWATIVRRRFRATVEITDLDVASALGGRDSSGEEQIATEYLLQRIVFVVPAGSGQGVINQRRSEANAFRNAFQGCDHSLEQASGNPVIVVNQPTRHEELPQDLQKEVDQLGVGGITQPDVTESGVQMFGICAKREISGRTQAETEVRQEMTSERGQLLARRYLRDLRSDAVIEYP
jgi:peptidyl-prolyl cis-trans isomerase SurA